MAFLQNLMLILNFSYSGDYLSDVFRKSLGYMPVIWTLIDDFYGPEVAVKAAVDIKKGNNKKYKLCTQGMWTKIMWNQGRYLIFLDLIISFFANHLFTLLGFAFACCMVFIVWMKIGGTQWISTGYLSVIFPQRGRAGPRELRYLILILCTLLSAFCFAVKFESANLAITVLITFCALYALVEEKGFTIALAILTVNWPIFLLAMIEKYPITSSLRGSFNSVSKKQTTK